MPDAFAVLDKDHREVEQLLRQLTRPGLAAERRLELADQLVTEASKHETVEEMYFWPEVIDRVAGGEALAEKATHQEDEGKEVLQRIGKEQSGDGELGGLLRKVAVAAREHIAFEESQVWPKLRENVSPTEADQLGEKLMDAKSTAPTRPHPRAPSSSGVQKTAGAAAAAVDKGRYIADGRG